MANTYNQCYVQIVFAVKYRENLISRNIRERIEKFITGVIQQKNQKLLAIYCNPDHVHILVSMDTKIAIADLVRDIKANSSKFINENNLIQNDFRWQEGYGSFTYSRKEIPRVALYIQNQEKHHRKQSFKDEYIELLNEHAIKFEEKYLFEFF